jgi:hypothetical protein
VSESKRKRDTALIYLRNIAGAIVSLPISLLLVTGIIIIAVMLLPVIWFVMILWWVNGFRHTLTGVPQEKEGEYPEEEK